MNFMHLLYISRYKCDNYMPLPLDFYLMVNFMGREHCHQRWERSEMPNQPHHHPRLPNLRDPLLPPPSLLLLTPPLFTPPGYH